MNYKLATPENPIPAYTIEDDAVVEVTLIGYDEFINTDNQAFFRVTYLRDGEVNHCSPGVLYSTEQEAVEELHYEKARAFEYDFRLLVLQHCPTYDVNLLAKMQSSANVFNTYIWN